MKHEQHDVDVFAAVAFLLAIVAAVALSAFAFYVRAQP